MSRYTIISMFQIGVFGIIFNEQNHVLLCHRRDRDLWNLPGGGLEKGEAPWEGVIREVREEVGVDTEIERLIGIYYKPKENEIVFSFLCRISGRKLMLSDEADRIEYFSIENIPVNTSKRQVERIHDATKKEKSDKVIFKVQQ